MKKSITLFGIVALIALSFNVASSTRAVPKTETAFSTYQGVQVAEITSNNVMELVSVDYLNVDVCASPIIYRLETVNSVPAATTDVRIKPVNVAQNRKPPRQNTLIYKAPRDILSC